MGRIGASNSAAGIAEGEHSNREINVNGHDWHPGKVRTPKASTVRRAAAIVWIVAGFGYLAVEAVAAARVPGYTYVADYDSDLGRPGSPLAWWMNAAFRVQGMAFVVAGALAVSAVRPRRGGMAFTVFACVYGAGSVLVGLFPSGGSATGGTHARRTVQQTPSEPDSWRCHAGNRRVC